MRLESLAGMHNKETMGKREGCWWSNCWNFAKTPAGANNCKKVKFKTILQSSVFFQFIIIEYFTVDDFYFWSFLSCKRRPTGCRRRRLTCHDKSSDFYVYSVFFLVFPKSKSILNARRQRMWCRWYDYNFQQKKYQFISSTGKSYCWRSKIVILIRSQHGAYFLKH